MLRCTGIADDRYRTPQPTGLSVGYPTNSQATPGVGGSERGQQRQQSVGDGVCGQEKRPIVGNASHPCSLSSQSVRCMLLWRAAGDRRDVSASGAEFRGRSEFRRGVPCGAASRRCFVPVFSFPVADRSSLPGLRARFPGRGRCAPLFRPGNRALRALPLSIDLSCRKGKKQVV